MERIALLKEEAELQSGLFCSLFSAILFIFWDDLSDPNGAERLTEIYDRLRDIDAWVNSSKFFLFY